jgi:hypothetical protein
MLTPDALDARQSLCDDAWGRGWGSDALHALLSLVGDRQYDPSALRAVLVRHFPNDRPARVLAWLYALTPRQVAILAAQEPYSGQRYSRPLTAPAAHALIEQAADATYFPREAIAAWVDALGRDMAPYAYAAGLDLREAHDLGLTGRLNPGMVQALAIERGVHLPEHLVTNLDG